MGVLLLRFPGDRDVPGVPQLLGDDPGGTPGRSGGGGLRVVDDHGIDPAPGEMEGERASRDARPEDEDLRPIVGHDRPSLPDG